MARTAGLEGLSILVTGGAGAIGRATGEALAASGAHVTLADRDATAAAAAAAAIRRAGGAAQAVPCDVTDAHAMAEAAAAATRPTGRLDGAFNAAGAIGPAFTGTDLALDDWRAVVDVNLTGCWLSMQAEIRAMRAAGCTGAIVNAASVAGLVGARLSPAYVAAKHGVVGLTRALALEVAGEGIRVNAVCPGWTDGPMTEAVEAVRADVSARMARRVPLGRTGRPGDTAAMVAWLLSPAAAYVTGAALPVDGGFTAA
ncbi:MAG: SDR family NAD(P)-dependent oxidoreductase [Pseudomonadota bacterium]